MPGRTRFESMQLAQKDELIDDLHLFVEPAFFGKIPNPLQTLSCEGLAKHLNLAGIGHGDANHHADSAGLACAVRPKQAKHRPFLNVEREIIYGDKVVVGFADFVQFNGVHGGGK